MNYSKLKVVYYNTKEIKHDDILWGLLELGVDVVCSNVIVTHNTIDQNEIDMLTQEIPNYDIAFTQDFSVNVAEACHICGRKYISWIYDSPQIALHTDFAKYPENYVFSFDRIQVKLLKEFGLSHVYYQPLAANTTFQSTIKISKAESQKYACDISFVGQLYRKDNLNSLFSLFTDAQKNLFVRYCNIYSCKWDETISIFDNTFDDFVETLIPYIINNEFDYYHLDPIYVVKCLFLCPFITHYERVRVLGELSKNYSTTLYTTKSDFEYAKSFFSGTLNSSIPRSESYKVFSKSKLNLNITLRTIESGIPLRVFDIMGMGGAVISNWQPEIEELFIPEKEIIVYNSLDELMDKTRFYLKNDKAREKIALNGKKRVIADYNMVSSLKSIIEKTV